MAKILMFVAVIIITAHNSIPHDHDHITLSAHHDHDEDDDHDNDHDVFSNNFLAHSFTQDVPSYNFKKQISAETPSFVLANTPAAINSNLWVVNISYSIKHEYPPPLREPSSVGFCGPPLMV